MPYDGEERSQTLRTVIIVHVQHRCLPLLLLIHYDAREGILCEKLCNIRLPILSIALILLAHPLLSISLACLEHHEIRV